TVTDYLALGREPLRTGNQDRYSAPCNAFRCRDGYITLDASLDHHFSLLAKVMSQPELDQDSRFACMRARFENREALNAIVEAWTAEHTREEVDQLLAAASVPAGPVRSIPEV